MGIIFLSFSEHLSGLNTLPAHETGHSSQYSINTHVYTNCNGRLAPPDLLTNTIGNKNRQVRIIDMS